jgi:hypothetical protein
MDLTLRKEYWIKFCMKLIAVVSVLLLHFTLTYSYLHFSVDKKCLNALMAFLRKANKVISYVGADIPSRQSIFS